MLFEISGLTIGKFKKYQNGSSVKQQSSSVALKWTDIRQQDWLSVNELWCIYFSMYMFIVRHNCLLPLHHRKGHHRKGHHRKGHHRKGQHRRPHQVSDPSMEPSSSLRSWEDRWRCRSRMERGVFGRVLERWYPRHTSCFPPVVTMIIALCPLPPPLSSWSCVG